MLGGYYIDLCYHASHYHFKRNIMLCLASSVCDDITHDDVLLQSGRDAAKDICSRSNNTYNCDCWVSKKIWTTPQPTMKSFWYVDWSDRYVCMYVFFFVSQRERMCCLTNSSASRGLFLIISSLMVSTLNLLRYMYLYNLSSLASSRRAFSLLVTHM